MIPSDHFTRFYNEVFKFLEKQGEEDLQAYWLEISKNQEKHTLELFREKGLQGMYEYWDHIRIEENCDLDLKYSLQRHQRNTSFQCLVNELPHFISLDNSKGSLRAECTADNGILTPACLNVEVVPCSRGLISNNLAVPFWSSRH